MWEPSSGHLGERAGVTGSPPEEVALEPERMNERERE